VAFNDAVNDVTRLATKIPAGMYRPIGEHPIYDQSQNEIAGYANHTDGLFDHYLPIVIFGDHTRIVKLADRPFFLGADGTKALCPKSSVVDAHYLFMWMKSLNLPDHGYSRHFKFLKEIRIPLPPLDEQRRIVHLLSRAAGIRRLREQALAKAREIIPALFLEMFGDPATNPKGWDTGTVGSVLSLAQYGTSKKASEVAEGMPVLRMGNVTYEGDLDLGSLKFLKLDENEAVELALCAGDLLFNRTNSKDLVGKTGLWDGRFAAVAASYFIRLRVNESVMVPVFLWAFMNTTFMKRRLYETARGAIGQANINTKELKAFSLPIPALAIQQGFAVRVAEVRSVVAQAERSLEAAKALERSLMGRLLGP
jgi:type I restriction enzyme S subunit